MSEVITREDEHTDDQDHDGEHKIDIVVRTPAGIPHEFDVRFNETSDYPWRQL